MLNALRSVVPSGLRHTIIHYVPSAIRHAMVEKYIAQQRQALKDLRAQHGTHWLEHINGWTNTFTEPTPENVTAYWKTIDLGGNAPKAYATEQRRWDKDWILRQLRARLPNGTVLDFGCNVGRVLHQMVEAGYRGIGVEINPNAVDLGQQTFPSLRDARFYVGEGTVVLPQIPTGSVDAIYTCAVLRHVAPEKIDTILGEFVRIAPKFIITVEDEGSLDHQSFPHDYTQKLGARGYREVAKDYAIDMTQVVGIGTMCRVYETGRA